MGVQKRRPTGTPPDTARSIRIGDEDWERAKRRATFENTTISHVVQLFVAGYAKGLVNPPRETVLYPQPEPGAAT